MITWVKMFFSLKRCEQDVLINPSLHQTEWGKNESTCTRYTTLYSKVTQGEILQLLEGKEQGGAELQGHSSSCKVEALDAASVPESQVTLSQEQQFSPLQFGGTSRTVIKDSLAMSRSALLGWGRAVFFEEKEIITSRISWARNLNSYRRVDGSD